MKPPLRALVTGGSGEIGSAISRRLAACGHELYIHAHHNAAKAQALAEELRTLGHIAHSIVFDVTNEAETHAKLDELLCGGAIHILVNNAGIHEDVVFPGMSSEQWHRVMAVTVDGFFNVTQPLMLPMIRARWGRIVNISSLSGMIGNRGQVNYSAAKGALNAATRSLSMEVASRGITVNAVAPGIIATQLTQKSFSPEEIVRLVPMKRAGTPEEVADLVAFLTSDQASYITGQIISINGGII